MKKVSIVISAYNEDGNIAELYQQLSKEIKKGVPKARIKNSLPPRGRLFYGWMWASTPTSQD